MLETSAQRPGKLGTSGVVVLSLSLVLLLLAISAQVPAHSASTGSAVSTVHGGSDPRVEIHLFYSSACPSCEVARSHLARLAALRPQVSVVEHDVVLPMNQALLRAFSDVAGVPADCRGSVPTVFLGSRYLTWQDITPEHLLRLVDGHDPQAGPLEIGDEEIEAAERALRKEGSMLSAAIVAAAGFVDGINPCAFAILVFLVSYLAFTGKNRRQILTTGVAFAGGVFATYLAAGFGLLGAIHAFRGMPFVHRAVYFAAAVMCFALAAATIHDLLQMRSRFPSNVKLRLPRRLTKFAHAAIKHAASSPHLGAAALLTGAVVATTEFVCTGQLYLPTIAYMVQAVGDTGRPAAMLLLYNLAFVAPMLCAVILTHLGTTSQRLAAFTRRYAMTVKAAIALVLVCLGSYLSLEFLGMLGLVA
ncbi:MAG: cytochrome c biogenesis protein CcdA [Clostridia bacterium]